MTLQWLIATFENHMEELPGRILPQEENQSYLISQQDPDNRYAVLPEGLLRKDIQVVRQQSAGLSRNRNHCLMHASGDVVVITDDDVQALPGSAQAILSTFEQWPDCDVLCFQIQRPDGLPYKTYPDQTRSLDTIGSLKQISSVEIAFRRKQILKAGIKFDERFGIGSPADHGEELLFLASCLRKGLKIRFIPVTIGVHPVQSSVNTRPFFENSRLFTSGAQNYVLYGKTAYILHFISVIRRLPQLLGKRISPIHFLRMKNRGCRYIRLSQNVCCVF